VTLYVVQIGHVGLRDLEVPSSVDFGGTQRVVVHKLHGGNEIVECLGPEASAIQFAGIFTGSDAAARYRAVDSIRLSGRPVWLTWGPFRRRIVVQSLHARYDNLWWIRFRIVCEVVPDLRIAEPIGDLAQQIFADMASITGLASGLSMETSPLSTALNAPQVFVPATSDQSNAANATSSLLSNVNSTIGITSDIVSSDVSPTARGNDLSAGITSLTLAAGRLATATTMRGYIMRIRNGLEG
jgi:hypothetical protein